MTEQSVKQFRPKTSRGEDVITAIAEDDMCHFVDWGADIRAYIERLENALEHIATKALENRILGVHHMDKKEPYYEFEGMEAYWSFLGGCGDTLLEAIEDHMKGNPNA